MKLIFSLFALSAIALFGAEPAALIKGTGPGWRAMTEVDFTNVNCKPDTWSWGKDGLIKCTGNPVGVIRTKKMVTNLELVVQWRHLKHAGNSGVFLWAMPESIKNLEAGKGRLPAGIGGARFFSRPLGPGRNRGMPPWSRLSRRRWAAQRPTKWATSRAAAAVACCATSRGWARR